MDVDTTDKDYRDARSSLYAFEGARQKALTNGNIRKYFVLSIEGGFEIEEELIESYPLEYLEASGIGKNLAKYEFENKVRQENFNRSKENSNLARYYSRRIRSNFDKAIARND